jgi:hypothetical protein
MPNEQWCAARDGANACVAGGRVRGAQVRGAQMGDGRVRGAQVRGAQMGDGRVRGAQMRGAQMGDGRVGDVCGSGPVRGGPVRGGSVRGGPVRCGPVRGGREGDSWVGSVRCGRAGVDLLIRKADFPGRIRVPGRIRWTMMHQSLPEARNLPDLSEWRHHKWVLCEGKL